MRPSSKPGIQPAKPFDLLANYTRLQLLSLLYLPIPAAGGSCLPCYKSDRSTDLSPDSISPNHLWSRRPLRREASPAKIPNEPIFRTYPKHFQSLTPTPNEPVSSFFHALHAQEKFFRPVLALSPPSGRHPLGTEAGEILLPFPSPTPARRQHPRGSGAEEIFSVRPRPQPPSRRQRRRRILRSVAVLSPQAAATISAAAQEKFFGPFPSPTTPSPPPAPAPHHLTLPARPNYDAFTVSNPPTR